jgi:ferritin-like metal-binding protein YciE
MPIQTLKELYVDELKDLYSAEQQILKALPKMEKKASEPELKNAFNFHLNQTREQVRRLEKILKDLDESPRGKKCLGMAGLIQEGSELLKEKADPAVKDAGLIKAAQSVEHYEIAGYGSARTFALRMGYNDAAQLLQQTLEEEGDTDHKLTDLAERIVNPQAQSNSGNPMREH